MFFRKQKTKRSLVFSPETAIQFLMFIVEVNGASLNEGMGDFVGFHIERIAFAQEEGGVFACFDASAAVIDAEDAGCLQADGRNR